MDTVVKGINAVIGKDTSPARVDAPAGKVLRVTLYGVTQTIQVVDQFGKPLDSVFAGREVFEGTVGEQDSINQRLRADGTYLDPVGVGPPLNLIFLAANDKANTDWLTAAVLPPPTYDKKALEIAWVAGQLLDPNIDQRRVIITPQTRSSARVQIIWR